MEFRVHGIRNALKSFKKSSLQTSESNIRALHFPKSWSERHIFALICTWDHCCSRSTQRCPSHIWTRDFRVCVWSDNESAKVCQSLRDLGVPRILLRQIFSKWKSQGFDFGILTNPYGSRRSRAISVLGSSGRLAPLGNFRVFNITLKKMPLLRANLGVWQTFADFQKKQRTSTDSGRLCQTFADFARLSQTLIGFRRLSQTFADFGRLSQTLADFRRLSQTFADFQKQQKTFADFLSGDRWLKINLVFRISKNSGKWWILTSMSVSKTHKRL